MPLKRNSNLVPLSRAHHYGLLFCWKIKQGAELDVPTSRIRAYVDYFWKGFLAHHIAYEENTLFKLLKDGIVQKVLKQHQAIRIQIIKATGDEANKEDVLKLAELLSNHIRFEERTLFPHAERCLSGEQLITLGKILSERPVLTDDDGYSDKFWEDKH